MLNVSPLSHQGRSFSASPPGGIGGDLERRLVTNRTSRRGDFDGTWAGADGGRRLDGERTRTTLIRYVMYRTTSAIFKFEGTSCVWVLTSSYRLTCTGR